MRYRCNQLIKQNLAPGSTYISCIRTLSSQSHFNFLTAFEISEFLSTFTLLLEPGFGGLTRLKPTHGNGLLKVYPFLVLRSCYFLFLYYLTLMKITLHGIELEFVVIQKKKQSVGQFLTFPPAFFVSRFAASLRFSRLARRFFRVTMVLVVCEKGLLFSRGKEGRTLKEVAAILGGTSNLLVELKEAAIDGLTLPEFARVSPPTLLVRLATAHEVKRDAMV